VWGANASKATQVAHVRVVVLNGRATGSGAHYTDGVLEPGDLHCGGPLLLRQFANTSL